MSTRQPSPLLRLLAVALLAIGLLAGPAPVPAAADVPPADALLFVPHDGQTTAIWWAPTGDISYQAHITASRPFEGAFSNDLGTDVFLYNPGPEPDGILHVELTPTGPVRSFRPVSVGGDYQPVVGRFDAGPTDDILWYAPGAAPDYIWFFDDLGHHRSVPTNVGANYRPVVVDVDGGPGIEDIIWYAPGAAPDYLWRFDALGNPSSSALTIGGDYHPFTGGFGDAAEGSPQQRVYWFNQAGPDYLWTFQPDGRRSSRTMPNVDGPYVPVVGNFTHPYRENVLFYRPGPGVERLLAFAANGSATPVDAPQVGGTYDVAVGDYDGNGYEDIAWAAGGRAFVWRFSAGGRSQSEVTTLTVDTTPFTSHFDTF